MSYAGHLLTENRHRLIVDAELTQATGTAEREAALVMIGRISGVGHKTVGANKGYDTTDFVECARLRSDTTCGQEGPRLGARRPNYQAWRLCTKSKATEAGQVAIRLDEGHRRVAHAPVSGLGEGRLDLHIHGGGLQCSDDAPTPRNVKRSKGGVRPANGLILRAPSAADKVSQQTELVRRSTSPQRHHHLENVAARNERNPRPVFVNMQQPARHDEAGKLTRDLAQ